ncbi:hypothetical protein BWO91_17710 [Plantibacter flavus]|uniref:hypothetical protein n=1 Tax=Plantibacter flavus TaxID=150123 RepID=UPI00099CC7DC|nr:hypothetical protein [Plantibacter flavus]AQX81557.1 hypothetical protein BWO91_17710 [Plantibacter flavus]
MTAVPTETAVAPVEGDLDGNGQLSEREKEILESKRPREVTLPDGSVVAVDPSQPLPAPVVQSITDQFNSLAAQFNGDGLHDEEILGQMYQLVDQKQTEIGRGVVMVFSFLGYWCTAASSAKSPIQGELDQASVISQAQAWASARDFELIVIG